jgi:hypothetical protein
MTALLSKGRAVESMRSTNVDNQTLRQRDQLRAAAVSPPDHTAVGLHTNDNAALRDRAAAGELVGCGLILGRIAVACASNSAELTSFRRSISRTPNKSLPRP